MFGLGLDRRQLASLAVLSVLLGSIVFSAGYLYASGGSSSTTVSPSSVVADSVSAVGVDVSGNVSVAEWLDSSRVNASEFFRGGTNITAPLSGNWTGYDLTADSIDLSQIYLDTDNLTDPLTYREQPASFIIFKQGGTTYCKNASSGQIANYSTTDDVPIQYAIDSLTNGGKLFITRGNYGVGETDTDHITLDSNITVEGEGYSTHLYSNNGSNAKVFYASNKQNIVIRNLRVDGQKSTQTGGAGIKPMGIYFSNVLDSRLEGLWVENCYNENLELENSTRVIVNQVVSSGAISNGFSIDDGSTDCLITNSYGIKSDASNFLIEDSQNCSILNSYSLGDASNQWGIRISANTDGYTVRRIIVKGNTVMDAQGDVGLYVVTFNSNSVIEDCLIEGNYIENSNRKNILLRVQSGTAIRRIKLVNNILRNSGSEGLKILTADVNNCTIRGNTISGSDPSIKITVNGAYDNTITDNWVDNDIFDNGTRTTIKDNIGFVTENSGTATLVNGTTSIEVSHGIASGLNIASGNSSIQVTPIEDLGSASYWFVNGVNATHFIINVDVDPVKDVDFNWFVEYTG